jgi:hypothetical protein
MPTEDEIIEYIHVHPGMKLGALCDAFDLPWCYSPLRLSPNGMAYGYTPEADALSRQLQRLRRAGVLRTTQGHRWEVRND